MYAFYLGRKFYDVTNPSSRLSDVIKVLVPKKRVHILLTFFKIQALTLKFQCDERGYSSLAPHRADELPP